MILYTKYCPHPHSIISTKQPKIYIVSLPPGVSINIEYSNHSSASSQQPPQKNPAPFVYKNCYGTFPRSVRMSKRLWLVGGFTLSSRSSSPGKVTPSVLGFTAFTMIITTTPIAIIIRKNMMHLSVAICRVMSRMRRVAFLRLKWISSKFWFTFSICSV